MAKDLKLTKSHFSAKVYQAYFHYLRKHYPKIDIKDLCQQAGLPYDYVSQEENWVSVTFDCEFTRLCMEKTGDASLCYKVGRQSVSPAVLGRTVHFLIKGAVSLDFIYSNLQHLTGLFSQVHEVQTIECKRGRLILRLTAITKDLSADEISALSSNWDNIIENTVGHYEAIPTIHRLPQAVVTYEPVNPAAELPEFEVGISYAPFNPMVKWVYVLLSFVASALTYLSLDFGGGSAALTATMTVLVFFIGQWAAFLRKQRELQMIFSQNLNNLEALDERYKALQSAKETQISLQKSYSRFVPWEFIQILNKHSILDVQLGDCIERRMTVLFSDMRSFTRFAENFSPIDTFKFLSGQLNRLSPMIRKHNGFIDKYIGDGIMAIFPESPEDAIRAALAMIDNMEEYNRARREYGHPPVRIGIGINTGSVILGTVGYPQQMQGTVVSDAVNVASRLEELTKELKVQLLVGSESIDGVKGLEPDVLHRRVGEVSIKGKLGKVQVYEVLKVENFLGANFKTFRQLFEAGLEAYERESLDQAKRYLTDAHALWPDDPVVKYYLSRIELRMGLQAA